MDLIESIQLGNDGILRFGNATLTGPVIVAIRNPENFPRTWSTLGVLYKIIPVNLGGQIFDGISDQRRVYLNSPNFCDFGADSFRVAILPVRWLYSKVESQLFLDIYN